MAADDKDRMEAFMHIVLVHVHVKSDFLDRFLAATIQNARNSVQEPGIARFDILQEKEDPTRITLVEVYRTAEDTAHHKETAHYNIWRETVADMMVEPRVGIAYSNVFPDEEGWG
jgi:(4S)-4-hydroxy-5-phosphonooxypentane-2,3-dione isomerase